MLALLTLIVGQEAADTLGVNCVTVLSEAHALDQKPVRVDTSDRPRLRAARLLEGFGLLRLSSEKSQFSELFEVTGEGRAAYRRMLEGKRKP